MHVMNEPRQNATAQTPTPEQLVGRQVRLLRRFGLPTAAEPWPAENLLATMRADKKALAGKLRFILPRRLGEVGLYDDVPEKEVRDVLATCTA